jgi:hypothetical protein
LRFAITAQFYRNIAIFLDAEDAALRVWLGPRDIEDDNELPQSDIFDGATNNARYSRCQLN